eukprot:gene39-20_t
MGSLYYENESELDSYEEVSEDSFEIFDRILYGDGTFSPDDDHGTAEGSGDHEEIDTKEKHLLEDNSKVAQLLILPPHIYMTYSLDDLEIEREVSLAIGVPYARVCELIGKPLGRETTGTDHPSEKGKNPSLEQRNEKPFMITYQEKYLVDQALEIEKTPLDQKKGYA